MRNNKLSFIPAFIFLSLTIVVLTIIMFKISEPQNIIDVFSNENNLSIVLDAGHGGKDGGAIGNDGTNEKVINLEITKKLKSLFILSGYNVIMTREEDIMLDTDDNISTKKMRDLKKRLQISSLYPNSYFVSIHCNKFPKENCKGLMVYYSDNENAKNLAFEIQNNIKEYLDNDNDRQPKKADSTIYLLHRAVSPSILIECGFLSNTEDLSNLKDNEYQKKLSLLIFSTIAKTD